MRLTTKGRYAVRAVLDLITNNGVNRPVRLQEISDRQDISLHYLEQLFRRLRKGNIVKSVRGPGGGYTLARSPEEITMKEVLINVGENIDPAKDLLGKEELKVSTKEFFIAKDYFIKLGNLMNEYLATSSLADVVRASANIDMTPKIPTQAPTEQTTSTDDSDKGPEISIN